MNEGEKNLYGWEMRLLQVEEDISQLQKDRKKCKEMVSMWSQK